MPDPFADILTLREAAHMVEHQAAPGGPDTANILNMLQNAAGSRVDVNALAGLSGSIQGGQQTIANAMNTMQVVKSLTTALRALLAPTYKDPVTGKARTMGKVGALDPGGYGEALEDILEQESSADIINPLYAAYEQRKTDLVAKFLEWRGLPPDQAAAEAKNRSLERLAVSALMFLRGDKRALKGLSMYVQQMSPGLDLSPTSARRRRALTDLATHLYENSVSLSENTPFRGDGVTDTAQALLGLMDKGAFKKLLHERGTFDEEGKLTDYGKARLQTSLTNAGRSVHALSRMFGQSSAVKSLQYAKAVLGSSILHRLDDKTTADALNTFYSAAHMTRLGPQNTVKLLAKMRANSPEGTSQALILRKAIQALSFENMGGLYSVGDPKQYSRLVFNLASNLTKSPFARTAAVGVAALEQEYGKDAAYNMMDSFMRAGIRSPKALGYYINKQLHHKILTKEQARNLLASPQATAYLESGRAFPMTLTYNARGLYKEMLNRSGWARKYFSRVYKEMGSLSPESIQQFMKNHNASPETMGQVNRHLARVAQSFAPQLHTTDLGTQLALINAGRNVFDRRSFLKRAKEWGTYSADTRYNRTAGGADAVARTLARTGNVGTSAIAGVTGYNSPVPAPSHLKDRSPYGSKPPSPTQDASSSSGLRHMRAAPAPTPGTSPTDKVNAAI